MTRRHDAPTRRRPPSSRPRRTSTRSSPTASAAPAASTCPATRAAPAPTPGCATRSARTRWRIDIPQDIHGVDLGPSPTPYERAEALAAEAYGARALVVPDQRRHAGQPRAVPGARAARRARRRAAQLARVDRRRARAQRRPARRSSRPSTTRELGMAHGVTPEALAARAGRRPAGPRRVHRLADLLRHGRRRRRRCAEVAHARDVALVVDQSWGPHFGFHPDLPPSALELGADAVLTSTHKIVGSLTQSAMLHVAPTRAGSTPRRVARAMRLVRSTSPSSLLMASLDAARRQLAVHGEALLHETIAAAGATRAKLDDDARRRAASTTSSSAAPASPPTTRCGSCSTRAGPAARATRSPTRCATPTTSTPSSRPSRRSSSCSASASRADALVRFAGDVDEIVKRIAQPGRGVEALVRTPAALENEVVVAPRDAFLGDAEIVPVDDAVGRDLVRVDRRLPARHPGAAAGRAHHRRDGRLPARARRLPARACTARRPDAGDDPRPGRTRVRPAAASALLRSAAARRSSPSARGRVVGAQVAHARVLAERAGDGRLDDVVDAAR